jgi:hypothetical protein
VIWHNREPAKPKTHQAFLESWRGIRPPASERQINVNRVSHKDGDAKHAQDYRDHFNHFDAPATVEDEK